MIPAHRITTEPALVRCAGCEWPLLFTMWAVRKLEQRYDPDGAGMAGTQQAQQALAAGQIDAIAAFLWVGLLHEQPALRFEDALELLDEAPNADLVALPAQIGKALLDAFGDASGGAREGAPWDWEMALAVWIKEWGRSEEEFWRTTFRTFTSIANGLSRLYDRSKLRSQPQGQPEGYTVQELLMMGRRR